MQTFLMYRHFNNNSIIDTLNKSITRLDYKRLGKQRVEAMQIINVLEGRTTAWQNHPAVKMWKGYINCLKLYCNLCIMEWVKRGYNNTMKKYKIRYDSIVIPFWLNNNNLILTHRSNLLRKDFGFYKQYHWKVKDDLPYYWPVK